MTRYIGVCKDLNDGFTLAEVLITLGIIGVVAALTMPSLIAKFQQQSFSTAFKKQFSVLNNSINYLNLHESLRECYLTMVLCPTETNPNNHCYSANTSDCNALKDRLISDLKMTTVEKDFVYPKKDVVRSNGGVSMNWTVVYDGIYSSMLPYLLPDGAILMFYKTTSTSADYGAVSFVLDVNGKKGPNRWGYDVFWLTLNLKGDTLRLTDEFASLSEKGGSLPRNILLNNWSNEFTNWAYWE